jgi:hypothetical protein
MMHKALFDRLLQQLLPEMSDPAGRRALLESALHGSPLLHEIDWTIGAAQPFTVRLVGQLQRYGDIAPQRPALVALLAELRGQVGVDRQQEIDDLIQALTTKVQKGETTMTLGSGVLIGFLLEVGRWAKSELSQIWEVRRAQQRATLTDRAQVEAILPAQIQSIVAEKSAPEVERIVALIERKRDAIDRARNAKLADREEYDQQRLARSAFEQREKEHSRTIKHMLDEIETDLAELGFDVKREPA